MSCSTAAQNRFLGTTEVDAPEEIEKLTNLKNALLKCATPLREYLAKQRNPNPKNGQP